MKKTVDIGCDHAGVELKERIKKLLEKEGIQVNDHGTHGNASVDYPDFGHAVANAVKNNADHTGILICGSGNGINMAANKHAGIRSALCWNAEIAMLARQHNDANILALPGRFITPEEAEKAVLVFLTTPFEGGRHAGRVGKIDC
jgi:ribose 5-phosphate isomerase B